MPVSRPSQHAQRALEVARVDVGDQAVLGVVGRGDRLLLGVEADHRRHRAEDLLLEQARVVGHVARARSARRSSRAPSTRCRRRPAPSRPCRRASSTSSATFVALVARRSAGPTSTPSSVPRPTFSSPILLGELLRRTRRATDSATWKRLADVQASPMLRIFAIIAPSTASSRSASSNTRNGRVAAQLHRHLEHLLGRLLDQLAPDLGRAGERQLAQCAGPRSAAPSSSPTRSW